MLMADSKHIAGFRNRIKMYTVALKKQCQLRGMPVPGMATFFRFLTMSCSAHDISNKRRPGRRCKTVNVLAETIVF